MTEPTKNGYELAYKLNPAIGTTRKIAETCSLIARHEKTLQRIAETWCSVEMSEKEEERLTKREEQLERRVSDLVASLPETDSGPFGVTFQGDPRGCIVKLTAPEPWTSLYDDWGRSGICVE